MFVMYVSLCALSSMGCNRHKYLENKPKAVVNLMPMYEREVVNLTLTLETRYMYWNSPGLLSSVDKCSLNGRTPLIFFIHFCLCFH